MIAGLLRVLFLGCLAVLASCGGTPHKPPVVERSAAPPRWLNTHIVARGDTLYSIAWRYGLDFRQLADANGIDPPYRIYPGQRLTLDSREGSTSRRTGGGEAERGTGGAAVAGNGSGRTAAGTRGGAGGGTDYAPNVSVLGPWQWPARGRVLRPFSLRNPVHKGIDIQGDLGQPVYAANSGKVVYAGSGLVGYGNLLIIKHNDQYLSAYANNNRLLVREGDTVKAGDRIAEIGDSGTSSVRLHFEIRRDGKPVDPLQLLPRR